mgnify:CR=1 FL=1
MAKPTGHSTSNHVSDVQSDMGISTKQEDNIFDVSIKEGIAENEEYLDNIYFYVHFSFTVYSSFESGSTNFENHSL